MKEHIQLKHALYDQVGKIGRALGQQTRLEIVEILAQAPRHVETIAGILKTDMRSVSQHLKILVESGLLNVERRGRFRWYSIAHPKVLELAVLLRQTAQTLTGNSLPPPAGTPLDVESALEMARAGKLTLIDVRPSEEYEAGHLPYSINIPIERIPDLLPTLDKTIPAAAYCRSSYCFLAKEAQCLFAEHGIRLLVIRAGVQDWLANSPEVFTA